jgi:excisionase family DNA binding protein
LTTTEHTGATARLHSIGSTAGQLSVGRTKVFQLVTSDKLRSITIGRRRLIPETAIAEYLDRLEQQSTPPVRARKPAMPIPSGRAPAGDTTPE